MRPHYLNHMNTSSEIVLSQTFIPRRYSSTLLVDISATHKSSSSPHWRNKPQVLAQEINSAFALENQERAPSKALACNYKAAEPVEILEICSNASCSDFFAQAVYPCLLAQTELKISQRIMDESSWRPLAENLKNLETTPCLRLQIHPKITDLFITLLNSSKLISSGELKTKKNILQSTPSQVNKDSLHYISIGSVAESPMLFTVS
ncbi:hypothetical protein BY996DRAFT_6409044 [Phakopsora pachyrhizi]|nr:hypothetical protein BY996DRAFT_6409044 [Phakopsora pachyrhizi]